jgi:hypothetical protein
MMLVNSGMFLLLLLLVISLLLKTIGGHEQHSSLSCGSAHQHSTVESEVLEEADAFMESWLRRRRELQQQQQQNEGSDNDVADNNIDITFVVPVCFHVIRPTKEGADVSTANATFLDAPHLQRQLDALNRGFSDASCCDPDQYEWCEPAARRCSLPTGFTFAMGQLNSNGTLDLALGTNNSTTVGSPCMTRSYSDVWYESAYGSAPIRKMQTLLRQGDATVLNVYFTDLRDPFGSPNVVGGIATFPEEYGLAPLLDGIFVSIRTVLPRDETEEPPETSVRFVVSVLCSFHSHSELSLPFILPLSIINNYIRPAYHHSRNRSLAGRVSRV